MLDEDDDTESLLSLYVPGMDGLLQQDSGLLEQDILSATPACSAVEHEDDVTDALLDVVEHDDGLGLDNIEVLLEKGFRNMEDAIMTSEENVRAGRCCHSRQTIASLTKRSLGVRT